MCEITSCLEPAVLRWLEVVLGERFGHAWRLSYDARGLILNLDASKGSIRFDSLQNCFREARSDLPVAFWDPVSEGMRPAMGAPIPAPGVNNLRSPLIEWDDQDLVIHYDILGLTFWMLTRQEEVGRSDLDEHGRFPASSSHAFRCNYLERPIVDEWLNVLSQAIKLVWPEIALRRHTFTIKVSHDVDMPSRYAFRSSLALARTICSDILKRNSPQNALHELRMWWVSRDGLNPKDPFNTFDWLMDLSERYGLTSAFYFICGHTDPHDSDYKLADGRIRSLMRHIHSRGHEIGLHPSYGSYKKPDMIRREADYLRRICNEEGIKQDAWGGRMHYLRWEQPSTLHAWASAGMSYDSSLGYADRPGFRCGTSFEYPAFDPVKGVRVNLRVRPLIAMECTIIDQRYLALGAGKDAENKFVQLKNACRAVGGCFTLLWHNSHFETQSERNLYKNLLEKSYGQ